MTRLLITFTLAVAITLGLMAIPVLIFTGGNPTVMGAQVAILVAGSIVWWWIWRMSE